MIEDNYLIHDSGKDANYDWSESPLTIEDYFYDLNIVVMETTSATHDQIILESPFKKKWKHLLTIDYDPVHDRSTHKYIFDVKRPPRDI